MAAKEFHAENNMMEIALTKCSAVGCCGAKETHIRVRLMSEMETEVLRGLIRGLGAAAAATSGRSARFQSSIHCVELRS
jgi:hypothetical protein